MPLTYEIETETGLEYARNPHIDVPPFQRREKWNAADRFKLCLSLFKGYPVGIVVLSAAPDEEDPDRVLLLDGRQRRATLRDMKNPESIYTWASSVLRLSSGMAHDAVRKKYWRFVRSFFGSD